MIMLDKLRSRGLEILHQLTDVRSLGLVAFGFIVVLVTWSGVKAVQTNYKLEQQITQLRQENQLQQLKNNNQKLKNTYYSTAQYRELAARQNFGLAAPGEKELLIPKDVALKYVEGVKPVTVSHESSIDQSIDKNAPFYVRHVEGWVNFMLHRGQSY